MRAFLRNLLTAYLYNQRRKNGTLLAEIVGAGFVMHVRSLYIACDYIKRAQILYIQQTVFLKRPAGRCLVTFKKRLSQYRFLKNELKSGFSIEPEQTAQELKEIERQVSSIADARVRQALFMRYLAPTEYSWAQVAGIVHYSEGRIRTLVREELRRIG